MSKETSGGGEHPIWAILEHQGRTIRWLATRIEYSESLVRFVKMGIRPATAEFRARCALALDLPESVLFFDASVRVGEQTAPTEPEAVDVGARGEVA